MKANVCASLIFQGTIVKVSAKFLTEFHYFNFKKCIVCTGDQACNPIHGQCNTTIGQCVSPCINWHSPDCCSLAFKCGIGEGGCHYDHDCLPGLSCGTDNCHIFNSIFPSNADCCKLNTKITYKVYWSEIVHRFIWVNWTWIMPWWWHLQLSTWGMWQQHWAMLLQWILQWNNLSRSHHKLQFITYTNTSTNKIIL